MHRRSGLQSLFSQKLDRALFATYFLGAVVPLLAFGYGVQRFALPAVQGDELATNLVLGSAVGIAMLSLAAFFAMRRLSLGAVRRMAADNERLAAILGVSRELADAPHVHAAAGIAAGCAHRLVPAGRALLVRQPAPDKPWELCESAGPGAQQDVAQHWDELVELVELASGQGAVTPPRPLGDAVAVALPLTIDEGTPGALVVVADARGVAGDALREPAILDALATLAGIGAVALHGAELKDSQRNFFTHATEIIVMALDARDPRQAGGCHAVAELANRIGRELGLDDESLRRMHFAALLSDIGMLKLPPAAQRNPQQSARHPQIGHRILSRIRLWEPLADIVLHHHDHWDGGGPEDAPRGEAIPVESRIIHVADAWMQLARERATGTQLTPAGILAELEVEAGARFDPRIIEALQRLDARGELQVG
jgi:HD-GYP domain-containing protein (c-di-GMP phosphodiesterase class II)